MKYLLIYLLLSPYFASVLPPLSMKDEELSNTLSIEKTLRVAQAAGTKISLDLSNAEITEKFRQRIWALLENTETLFINEESAYALTHLPLEEALSFLKNFCPTVVLQPISQN